MSDLQYYGGTSVNILILAAGKITSNDSKIEYPLCLTEINGVSLLERIVNNTKLIVNAYYTFTFLESETLRFHLGKIAALLVPGARSVNVPELTQGSACTALLATCQLEQESELIIISANELVDIDLGAIIQDFRKRDLDAGTLIFRSSHPRYSYVTLNENELVTQTAQREPISTNATTGIFWFAKTFDFVEGAKNLIRKDAHVDGSYFVALTFNELVLKQKKIGVITLPFEKYIPLKTIQQIDHYHGSGNP